MGISKLFLKEILEICDFLNEIPRKKNKSNINVIFLGDQDIRIKNSQLYSFKKANLDYSTIEKIKFKNKLIELKDLFPKQIQSKLNIKTIDINGNPDLKIDITSSEEIIKNSILKNSISHFIDIGTIEHVINPYKALSNINQLIEINGYVSHLVPCSSYLNHGYYTISPQLLNDFYSSKNYEILRFNTISYFGNYDSSLSLSFNIRYNHKFEIKGLKYMISKGKFIMAFESFLRRILLRLAKETYVSFTAKKLSDISFSKDTLYQKQYE